MKRINYLILWVCTAMLLNGCGLFISSHHRTEDYKPVFADASAGNLAAVQKAVQDDKSLLKETEWGGVTLLHDAVQQNQIKVAEFLLKAGANVNALTEDRLAPLHMAAQNGNGEMIELLLDHRAKINPVDAEGWTPLDRAEKWEHPAAAEMLKHRGASHG